MKWLPLYLTSPANTPFVNSGIATSELRFREALVLWLRWNEAYEQATAHMFASGQSAEKIEAFMDNMDQLRSQAISLSHELLD